MIAPAFFAPGICPSKGMAGLQVIHPDSIATHTYTLAALQNFSHTCEVNLNCEHPYFLNPLLAACQVRGPPGFEMTHSLPTRESWCMFFFQPGCQLQLQVLERALEGS